jgi:LCP family protein required for cell wall assembly
MVFHPWRTLTIAVIGVILGFGGFYLYQVNTALSVVAAEDFDPVRARTALAARPDPTTTLVPDDQPFYDLATELAMIAERLQATTDAPSFNTAAFGEPIPDDVFDSYLLVGADGFGLADAIILALQPSDGAQPIMVSLPRDLFVWNLCRETFTRLNAGLAGCRGVASGSELMALMVEDYTGIPIDHVARVDFDGFAGIVDTMGGVTVCVDRPTRDVKAHLLISSTGCQRVDGRTALAWVRSRSPEHLIGGAWVAVGGSDYTRQRAQQDVLFQLAGRAASFSSPAVLTERLSAVASSVRLDSSWTLGQAVSRAWQYRGISKDSVSRFSISVRDYRTSYGARVLLPTKPFRDDLATVYDLP